MLIEIEIVTSQLGDSSACRRSWFDHVSHWAELLITYGNMEVQKWPTYVKNMK